MAGKRGIIATMEALGFDEFPESLHEIPVGRVSRQPQERDVKAFRLRGWSLASRPCLRWKNCATC